MRKMLLVALSLFSMTALAHVANTLDCGDGVQHKVRFNVAGRPGYIVLNGIQYFLRGVEDGKILAQRLEDPNNITGLADFDFDSEKLCTITSYRVNP